jgi:hypothetical protein
MRRADWSAAADAEYRRIDRRCRAKRAARNVHTGVEDESGSTARPWWRGSQPVGRRSLQDEIRREQPIRRKQGPDEVRAESERRIRDDAEVSVREDEMPKIDPDHLDVTPGVSALQLSGARPVQLDCDHASADLQEGLDEGPGPSSQVEHEIAGSHRGGRDQPSRPLSSE